MGNAASSIDPVHLRIYSNIIQITNPEKRVQMINTCLSAVEYVTSAKRSGIYSYLLNYVSTVNSGQAPPLLPGEQRDIMQSSTNYISNAPPVPRAFQAPPTMNPGTATHPSLASSSKGQQITTYSDNTPTWKVITNTPKQKAMTYFASCLEVLGIQEEVALTEESLKSAYKKMALKAHPDKGGSEEYFEAVTRAYAYLSEILKTIKGGRKDVNGRVEAPTSLSTSRDAEAEKWKHAEPVRLNAKNLDMNIFNRMFEQTHMPDPDSDGYGDWLKGNDTRCDVPKFKGEFNRDVFNRVFEEEARKGGGQSNSIITHPGQMALTLNPTSGVDLVGERPSSFTAAPNSKMQFTDLRGAYTSESTISDKVSNVQVTERNYEQYRASREKGPDPFTQSELHSIQDFEARQKRQDQMLEQKRAQMHIQNQQYFERMKGLVITDGVDLNQSSNGHNGGQKRLGY
jgi:curved DNA-binding protein CbpA